LKAAKQTAAAESGREKTGKRGARRRGQVTFGQGAGVTGNSYVIFGEIAASLGSHHHRRIAWA